MNGELWLAQEKRRGELNEAVNAAISGGFFWGGNRFQIDDRALSRMVAVLSELRAGDPDAHGGFWLTVDNERVELDSAAAVALLENAVATRLSLDQFWLEQREKIQTAETVEDVDAVAISPGGE